jgi:[ribosomal protein S18]-alanine N-acetyltransferase
MFIRIATSADLPDIMVLERESELAAHWSESQYHQAFSGSTPRRLVLTACEKEKSEVAKTGVVRGFIVVRIVEHEWEIENIAVHANSQRSGIAMQLLNEIRKSAESENAMKIFLEVRRSNAAARALYEKCGFQNCGYRSQYYSNPSEDAVEYQLCLQ